MTLEVFGEIKKASETGDGPVDAIFKCIKKLYSHEVTLQLYNVHAVTEGTDAQATVSVRIEEQWKNYSWTSGRYRHFSGFCKCILKCIKQNDY